MELNAGFNERILFGIVFIFAILILQTLFIFNVGSFGGVVKYSDSETEDGQIGAVFPSITSLSAESPQDGISYPADVPRSANTITYDWTFMVYLDGDNNLEGAAIDDINEMEEVGSTSSVKIIVQMDRIPGYDTSNGDYTDAKRYEIIKDTQTSTIGSTGASIGEVNMGDSSTLSSFIDWAQTNYPANHYALIMWDHGSGAMYGPYLGGVCFDDSSSGDYISESELISAISGKGIDLVGFDACLMGASEWFYALSPYTSVIVGSEKTEPGDGWPYNDILSWLVSNPSATPQQLGETIVQKYYDFYLSYVSSGLEVTQSAAEGTGMADVVSSLDSLVDDLINNMGTYKTALTTIRDNLHEYDDEPYVDLWEFADGVENDIPALATKASALKTSIENAVILSKYTGSLSFSHGMSIYYPKDSASFSNSYRNNLFSQNSRWDEFLLSYYDAPVEDDQFEDNDDFASAALIYARRYNSLVCDDDDYYKIDIKVNQTISVGITYTPNAGIADLTLSLYAENKTSLGTSNNHDGQESVSWTCDSNQTVYIKVYNEGTGSKISYDMNVYIPVEDDGFEENDNKTDAADITGYINSTISHLVCIDDDVYVLTIPDDNYVQIYLDYIAAQGLLDLIVCGIDYYGDYFEKKISTADDGEYFEFGTQQNNNQTYYIIVHPYENNTDYNLTVYIDPDFDDSFDDGAVGNDYVNYASTVSVGVYNNLVGMDMDYYNITLTEGDWLNVSIYFLNKEGDLDLYLYDWTSNYPAASSYYWVDNEMIIYHVPANGTYTIMVSPYDFAVNPEYNMSISIETDLYNDAFDSAPNDHWDGYADQHANFPELSLDTWYTNLTAWDEDWYKVEVPYNQPVIFSLMYDNMEGTLILLLYDSSGDLIDYSFTSTPNEYLYYDPSDYWYSYAYDTVHYIRILPLQRLSSYNLSIFREPNMVLDFNAVPVGDLAVSFTDQSTQSDFIEAYYIDFGDGTSYFGDNPNLIHIYPEIGSYHVTYIIYMVYGMYYSITDSVYAYATPVGFEIWLQGDNPVSSPSFTVSWNISNNAQSIYLYILPGSNSTLDDLTPDYSITEPDEIPAEVTITVNEPGTYYIQVMYANPLGNSTSNILEVEVPESVFGGSNLSLTDIGIIVGVGAAVIGIVFVIMKKKGNAGDFDTY